MGKNYTEEEIKEIIAKIVRKSGERKKKAYEKARLKMEETEHALYLTLNEKQRLLYDKYCKKRENFYEKANEIYVNMYIELF